MHFILLYSRWIWQLIGYLANRGRRAGLCRGKMKKVSSTVWRRRRSGEGNEASNSLVRTRHGPMPFSSSSTISSTAFQWRCCVRILDHQCFVKKLSFWFFACNCSSNDSRIKCKRRANKLEKREFTKSRLLRQKNTAIIVPIAHVARACKWWGLFGSKSEQKITRSRISPLLSFASIRYYVIPRTVISSLYTDVIKLIVDTITRCTFSFRELLFSYIIHVMYIYILISWLD